LSRGKNYVIPVKRGVKLGATANVTLTRRGDKGMRTRKIVEVRGSQYINIPKDVREALNTKRGERMSVEYVPSVGMVITQLKGADRIPIKGRTMDDLKKEADFICAAAERKLMKMKLDQIDNFHGLMMKEFVKLGIFDLKSRVNELEKEATKIKMGRGKLSLVGQRKRSP
jgi:bifunctional DNA-binding transcriptional regulator/antitoxin component of YhaV-PrlF toxin-antitoxin module